MISEGSTKTYCAFGHITKLNGLGPAGVIFSKHDLTECLAVDGPLHVIRFSFMDIKQPADHNLV